MSDRNGKGASDYSDYSYISEAVIKKAVDGEKDALEQIFLRYRAYVRTVIRGVAAERNMKLNKELFEDIEQTVWESIIKSIKKFQI